MRARRKERPVAKAGDVIGNPITGEQITFLKTTRATNGELLRFEYVIPPGFVDQHRKLQRVLRYALLGGFAIPREAKGGLQDGLEYQRRA